MGAAANESAAQDDESTESDVDLNPPRASVWAENDDSEHDLFVAAEQENEDPENEEMVRSKMVARHLMLMRTHPRSNGDIACDVLQLVHLRNNFVRKHDLCGWLPLSPEKMMTI